MGNIIEETKEKLEKNLATLKVNEDNMTGDQMVRYAAALKNLKDSIVRDAFTYIVYSMYDGQASQWFDEDGCREYSENIERYARYNAPRLLDCARHIVRHKSVRGMVKEAAIQGLFNEADIFALKPVFQKTVRKGDDGAILSAFGEWNRESRCWQKRQGDNVSYYYRFPVIQ